MFTRPAFRIFLIICLLALSLSTLPPTLVQAATHTVSNCNDAGAGSLRQAVEDAIEGDTIQFSLDCPESDPITLASAINIDKDLTISGHEQTIVISGSDSTRIFLISSSKTVRLEYLTLMNANGGENQNGGAILDYGSHLTIANAIFKNNRLTGSSGDKGGAAIAHLGGSNSSLTIEKSRFEGNSTQNLGGAILTSPPTIITDTTFSANAAYRGTVVSYNGQHLTIERSTFHNNVIIKNLSDVPGSGGAIYFGSGTLQVKNSTFSGNGSETDAVQGGAIYTYGSANVLIWNSTFTNNKIENDGYRKGGGIHITSNSTLSYYNTISAGNSPDDCALENSGIAQDMNNLVQVNAGCGTPTLSDDPQLGPLQNNGGFTPTHALLPGSPAIDAGHSESCLATDQRDVARPQGAGCDIGAYEAKAPDKFSKISPINGASNQALSPTLSWQASEEKEYYTYCVGTASGNCNIVGWTALYGDETVTLTGLSSNTTYYWQVKAVNHVGTTESDGAQWWSFTTAPDLPGAFSKTTPANGAIDQSLFPTLSWQPSAGAISYQYCINTSNDNGCTFWVSNGNNTSVSLSGLKSNTTYYWQARATNIEGITYANVAATNFWSFTTGDAIATFPDVPISHWAWAFVERLANAGITSGFPDGTYRPENNVIRAEIAIFLLKGINFPTNYNPPQATDFNFSDIENHWARHWIEALRASGITGGFADGTYRPDQAVTRAEMAVFLLKAVNGPGYSPPVAAATFSDVEGHWAQNWIEALRSEGITGGYPDGSYRPDNTVSRAEMAVFIINTFGLP